jgi:hypothetical protein
LKTEILDVTFGEKTGGKTKKNWYFTKIEPYLYEFVANESSFGIFIKAPLKISFVSGPPD